MKLTATRALRNGLVGTLHLEGSWSPLLYLPVLATSCSHLARWSQQLSKIFPNTTPFRMLLAFSHAACVLVNSRGVLYSDFLLVLVTSSERPFLTTLPEVLSVVYQNTEPSPRVYLALICPERRRRDSLRYRMLPASICGVPPAPSMWQEHNNV